VREFSARNVGPKVYTFEKALQVYINKTRSPAITKKAPAMLAEASCSLSLDQSV